MTGLNIRVRHQLGDLGLDLAFESDAGITCLLGPSGAGKTSLLNIIAGLLPPHHARIEFNGTTFTDTERNILLPPEKRRVGYVFQDGKLFPHMTVEANLRFGINRSNTDYLEIINLLALNTLTQRRPATLSGGEKKRTALARALLSHPQLLLMDEPLSGLDPHRRQEFYPYLADLPRRLGIPVIYVTHQIEEVLRLGDRLIVIDNGHIVGQGPLETVLNDPEIQTMLLGHPGGGRNPQTFLDGQCSTRQDGLSEVQTAWGNFTVPGGNRTVGTRTHLRIHARDIALALDKPDGLSIQNALCGMVHAITPAGEGLCNVHIKRPETPHAPMLCAQITLRSSRTLNLMPGQEVWPLVKAVAFATNVDQ